MFYRIGWTRTIGSHGTGCPTFKSSFPGACSSLCSSLNLRSAFGFVCLVSLPFGFLILLTLLFCLVRSASLSAYLLWLFVWFSSTRSLVVVPSFSSVFWSDGLGVALLGNQRCSSRCQSSKLWASSLLRALGYDETIVTVFRAYVWDLRRDHGGYGRGSRIVEALSFARCWLSVQIVRLDRSGSISGSVSRSDEGRVQEDGSPRLGTQLKYVTIE